MNRHSRIVTARGTEHVVARQVVRFLGAAAGAQSLGVLALTGCVWAWLPAGVPGGGPLLVAAGVLGVAGLAFATLAVSWSL